MTNQTGPFRQIDTDQEGWSTLSVGQGAWLDWEKTTAPNGHEIFVRMQAPGVVVAVGEMPFTDEDGETEIGVVWRWSVQGRDGIEFASGMSLERTDSEAAAMATVGALQRLYPDATERIFGQMAADGLPAAAVA